MITHDSSQMVNLILISTFLGLIALITAGGNIIVLLAFYYDKKLRAVNDYFIMNMAIADFLVGFFCVPFYIPFSVKQSWPFGHLFCKIWVTVDDVTTMASVVNIVAISINRYWSIAYPISYRKYVRQNFVYLIMIAVWCLSFINFAPGIWLIGLFDKIEENRKDCSGDYNRSFIYMLIAQFNYFIWPFILLCILNFLIMLNIWKRTKKMTNSKPYELNSPRSVSNKSNTSIVDPYRSNRRQLLRYNRESSLNNHEITDKRNLTDEYSPIINQKTYRTNKNYSKSSKELKGSNYSIKTSSQSRILSIKSLNMKIDRSQNHCSDSVAEYDIETETQLIKTIKNKKKENYQTDQRDLRIKRDRKAARSLFILVMVFLTFLFPYVICAIITTAGFKVSETVFEISFWLLWLNSTCNPFLYPFIQIKYRRAYIKLFQSLFQHIHFKASNYLA